jgi:hypothetical protein
VCSARHFLCECVCFLPLKHSRTTNPINYPQNTGAHPLRMYIERACKPSIFGIVLHQKVRANGDSERRAPSQDPHAPAGKIRSQKHLLRQLPKIPPSSGASGRTERLLSLGFAQQNAPLCPSLPNSRCIFRRTKLTFGCHYQRFARVRVFVDYV